MTTLRDEIIAKCSAELIASRDTMAIAAALIAAVGVALARAPRAPTLPCVE